MLDGLLGRGFSSKCKSLIKLTRTRIDVIRRNKDARQRIMKKDIADLLANGLDTNAFIRTEEYFAGMCLLFCYDFIEQSCESILKQLSIMQKQRECPEECREAVSSLTFAAARFSDLPELRDLRDTFKERYGNSLDRHVNQKFVEKLASNPPTMEKKLQILEEIALEFSVKWGRRGYEQSTTTASAFTEDPPGKCGPIHVIDDRFKLQDGKNRIPRAQQHSLSTKDRDELVINKQMMRNGMEGNKFVRKEFTSNGDKPLASREETTPNKNSTIDTVRAGTSFRGQQNLASSTRKVQEERTDRLKSFDNNNFPPPYIRSKDNVIPPPYIKSEDRKYDSIKGSMNSSSYCSEASIDPSSHNSENAVNGSERVWMEPEQNHEGKVVGPVRVNRHGHEKDHICQDVVPLPKPRSVKKKHSKSSSTQNGLGNFGDTEFSKRSSSSRRRDNSRRGLQILFEDEHHHKDEEERVLDKLLLHFSKKPSNYEAGKVVKRSKDHPSHQMTNAGGYHNSRKTDGPEAEPDMVPPPTRSVSLPRQQKAKNVFARTNSVQARHVHPNLPDYDDLAERIAALRER